MFVYLKNRNVFGMCVFNLKKADTFDRINIFLFRRENTLYSRCSSLRLFLLFPFSSLRAENQTHALNSSPSMQQKIDWDSHSLDLISTVSMPRPSNLQGFCRHRPIQDPSSNLHFHLPSSVTNFKSCGLWCECVEDAFGWVDEDFLMALGWVINGVVICNIRCEGETFDRA